MHYDHYDGHWTIKWAWMTEFLCIMIRYVNICHYDRCMGQLCQLTLILASLRPRLLRIWRPVWHGMTYSPNYPISWHLWALKYQSPRGLALIMLLCIRFETKLHVILLVSKIVPPPLPCLAGYIEVSLPPSKLIVLVFNCQEISLSFGV